MIYFEEFDAMQEARSKEKQLKNWHKQWKWSLIKASNPNLLRIEINKKTLK
nr:hypothetical protein [Algibacter onchidii]